MTPTLLGRWQQRLFLLVTVALILTLPLVIVQRSGTYLLILLYLGLLGCCWDILHQQFQRMRWDGDWPGVLQFLGSCGEGSLLLLLVKIGVLPGLTWNKLPLGWLFGHYILISVAMFAAAHSLVLIFFPHARYQGRQWL